MENEPYLDLTYGTGGEQYRDEDDDDDDPEYGDVQQDNGLVHHHHHHHAQAQHGFGMPFVDAFASSTGMGMSDEEEDEIQYDDEDDVEMEESPSGHPQGNIHHDGLFHYDHHIHPSASQASQCSSASMASAAGGDGSAAAAAAAGSNAVEEHTGRWTIEEHEAFLRGLQMHGKEWKKVAAQVRTRTVVQTRTHAQKYFQKLQKTVQENQLAFNRRVRNNMGGTHSNEPEQQQQPHPDSETQRMIEIMNSANPDEDDPMQVLASTGTRGRNTRGRGARRSNTSIANTANSSSSSAMKISTSSKRNMTNPHRQPQPQPLLPPPRVVDVKASYKSSFGGSHLLSSSTATTPHSQRRGSTTTLNAAQVISTLSSAKTTGTAATSNIHRPQPQQSNFVTAVGSSHPHVQTPSRDQSYQLSNNNINSNSSSMKIIAPDPSKMGRQYAFPEPSPAATGKRKLAEIAAAQMLAGVMSSSNSKHANNNPTATVLDFSQSDGPPTPPMTSNGQNSLDSASTSHPIDLNEAPPLPPLFSTNSSSTTTVRPSLQIVNPEVFGILPSSFNNANGRTSPVTPWDSELNALIGLTTVSNTEDRESVETFMNEVVEIGTIQNQQKSYCERQQEQQQQQRQREQSMLPPIRGPVDEYSRTPLHQAICAHDEETVKTLIDVIGNQSKDLNQYDTAGYTPLHSACCTATVNAANISSEDENGEEKPNEIVRMLLKAGCNPFLLDASGNSPLHWSVRACDYDATQQLLNLVSSVKIDAPLDSDSSNNNMNNCNADTNANSNVMNDYVNLPNQLGETCMHWAARGGIRCCDPIVPLLLSYSATTDILNKASKRPIDVVAEGYMDEPNSSAFLRQSSSKGSQVQYGDCKKKSSDNRELTDAIQRAQPDLIATRAFLLQHSLPLRTLVLHHPECLDHHPKSMSDWETPDRVRTILHRLNVLQTSNINSAANTSGVLSHEIVVSQDFDRGNLELLSRVHSTDYLSFVNQLSKDLERKLLEQGNHTDTDTEGYVDSSSTNATTKWGLPISSSSLPVVPFTPMVQRTMIKVAESNVKLSDNSDTSFSVGSLRAARRAAGAVQHAIDWYVYDWTELLGKLHVVYLNLNLTILLLLCALFFQRITREESKFILYRPSSWSSCRDQRTIGRR
jgi:SHAQKYF class myb-like DNA-binding protein